jgi:hypothetical protein
MRPRAEGSRLATAIAALAAASALTLIGPSFAAGAAYLDQDGHTVQVQAPKFPPDPGRDQAFVDLLGSLVHGDEIETAALHLADAQELQHWCGASAGACVTHGTIHIPGWLSPAQQRIVLAHEYGHIVHSNRDNPPIGSINAGTKRWATYERICEGLRTGQYGDFDYYKTPREAFAQAYATLNFGDAQWEPFEETLRPDAQALEAIRQDVLDPWRPVVSKIKGRMTKSKRKVVRQLALPLDGELIVRLKARRTLKVKLSLVVAETKQTERNWDLVGFHPIELEHEVCGERTGVLRVKAARRTRGKFRLVVERP